MDFYILKKQQELIAIPANEQSCKQYLDSGYFYIDKVAACNEKNAIKALQAKQTKAIKIPLAMALLALPMIIFAWYSLSA
ncbi:hypothetical protein [Pseudoalteromonas sp. H105]|jgi:hypothetical protein|uniref:hypothetical protein n=1 Tax=Pseudoalteromonas sp. H105 TaxID=1348393 RepID=UPI000731FD26|nr:hypothetical protein [Pseudoalteromonas sp. H105]KTF16934.1 hypothetical protein ATS75_05680 [Pseudoalteromonas sp. H105]